MSKQPPTAPTASAVDLCPTVGRPGTGSLPSTIAPPQSPSIGGAAVGAGGGCLDSRWLIGCFEFALSDSISVYIGPSSEGWLVG